MSDDLSTETALTVSDAAEQLNQDRESAPKEVAVVGDEAFVDQVHIIDEHAVSDQDGKFNMRRGSEALAHYRQQKAAQTERYEQQVAEPGEPDASAVAEQYAQDELEAGLRSLGNRELEALISDPTFSASASKVLQERHRDYERTLGQINNLMVESSSQAIAQQNESRAADYMFARELLGSTILARHGLETVEQFQALQQTDMERQSVIAGELAQAQIYLDRRAGEIMRHHENLQRICAENAQQQFNQFAQVQDEAFARVNPQLDTDQKREMARRRRCNICARSLA